MVHAVGLSQFALIGSMQDRIKISVLFIPHYPYALLYRVWSAETTELTECNANRSSAKTDDNARVETVVRGASWDCSAALFIARLMGRQDGLRKP